MRSQEELESTSKEQNWHEFPETFGKIIVKKIVLRVSRRGTLTLVAELKPINVGSILVNRASLYNKNEIKRKDIREGDTVIVKAGRITAHIVKVDKSVRPPSTPEFVFPKFCPECGKNIFEDDLGTMLKCSGEGFCRAQAIEKLRYFTSCFDIEVLERRQISFFYDLGLIKEIPDIFTLEEKLKEFDLEQYKGWGKREISELLDAINNSRVVSLSQFISSLGIEYIGPERARLLANHYKSYENWYAAMVELPAQEKLNSAKTYEREDGIIVMGSCRTANLIGIHGIGDMMTDSLLWYFRNKENIKMIEDFASVLTILPVSTIPKDSIFSGKTVVFTGELFAMSRKKAQNMTINLGAKVCAQVSPKTDYLIVGQNPGSKYSRGMKLGIKILNEEEWINLSSLENLSPSIEFQKEV